MLPLDSFYRNLEDIMDRILSADAPDYSGVTELKLAPNVNVYVGNREFDAYIVETAGSGISMKQYGNRKARGE